MEVLMKTIKRIIQEYLDFCCKQKRLDAKTIRAYEIDLTQFITYINAKDLSDVTSELIEKYLKKLHSKYKPKTVKRKIASLKAFFRYADFHELVPENPWNRVQCYFREPVTLPRTIPLGTVKRYLSTIYDQMLNGATIYRRRNAIRDAAICELLFSTGLRIFELCSLSTEDVNLEEDTILIHGKRNKERIIQIGNKQVHDILIKYKESYINEISSCRNFFTNQKGHPFSDQAVRRMLNYYANLASIEQHITPHMWRHTFATVLLDADVDIRYIQEMLGHSSIRTTEIYTHVSMTKQKDILCRKHPRNNFII